MVYLYYHQKMQRIKRKARVIPFGYKESDDPDYIEPVQSELDALEEAKEFFRKLKQMSKEDFNELFIVTEVKN